MGKRSRFRGVSSHGRKWKAQINHGTCRCLLCRPAPLCVYGTFGARIESAHNAKLVVVGKCAASTAGTQFYLGLYTTEEEAARAYDNAARVIHAQNAVVNFPNTEELDRLEKHEKVQSDLVHQPTQAAMRPAISRLLSLPAASGPPRPSSFPIAAAPSPPFAQKVEKATAWRTIREELNDIQHLNSYRAELQHKLRCLQVSMPWIEKSLAPSSQDALVDELVVLTILEHDVSTRIHALLRRHSPSSQHPSESSEAASSSVHPLGQSSAESVSTGASVVSYEQRKSIELYPYSAAGHSVAHNAKRRKSFSELYPLADELERKMQAVGPDDRPAVDLQLQQL